MPSVVFFGNEKLATGITAKASVRQALAGKGYKVHSIDKNLENKEEDLRSLKPDIGVLVAYGRILPKSILDIFPHGVINIHPSLLPKGRGPTPIEDVILRGSSRTGVSIIQITEKMDAGPIFAQQAVGLNGSETKQKLADMLLDLGVQLLIDCLDDIFSGKASSSIQDEDKATYTKKISKEDGTINWNKPAVQLEREIRAYAGWPRSRTKIIDTDCIITKVEIQKTQVRPGEIEKTKDSLIIGCSGGSLLIKSLQPSGKKEMTASEFIRGYLK